MPQYSSCELLHKIKLKRYSTVLSGVSMIAIATLLIACTTPQPPTKLDSDLENTATHSSVSSTDKPLTGKSTELKNVNSDISQADNAYENMDDLSHENNTVSATVISTGCTRNSDFSIKHTVLDDTCQVLVVRDKPDLCKAAPHRQKISVQWRKPSECNELGLRFLNQALPSLEGNAVKGIKK